MNMVISSVPVLFLNPFSGKPDSMPVEMIGAYFPNGTALCLEEAARVASIRDHDAAINLMDSAERYSVSNADGCGLDLLAVEPPSLR